MLLCTVPISPQEENKCLKKEILNNVHLIGMHFIWNYSFSTLWDPETAKFLEDFSV